ncbi:MAG: GAF and ANTAR domain-containing protein [Acidimicrobiia bacterium]
MKREQLVVDVFVQLADSLVDDFDIIDLLTVLSDGCVRLDPADAAGILLADEDSNLRVMAASSERARLLELFQLQNHEGPCLEAYSTGQPVTHTDLANSVDRWPHFGPEAVSAGFGSVHAIPLRLRTIVIGALNLFAAEARPLDEPNAHLARALADVASIAILQDQAAREAVLRAGQLQYALDSRVAIEQAKGMVAERTKTDMDEAFRILRKYARDSRRHLSAVATDIAAGTVPLDEVISATVLSESDHKNG